MSDIALTGHTRGLGLKIIQSLAKRNHRVMGFSKSSGCDLRDYSQVSSMLETVKNFDWFINCAHPDYCQSQILYRLIRAGFCGKVLSIGSPVVHNTPLWTDLGLLEYVTQKSALYHAHTTLTKLYPEKFFLWEPDHVDYQDYIDENLIKFGL